MPNPQHRVTPVSLPPESGIARAYASPNLADAYSIELPPGALTDPVLLARFIFSHQPPWISTLTAIRDALVGRFGLKTAKQLTSLGAESKRGRLSIFKIYGTSSTEVVLGEDDKHLDFRLSVLCSKQPSPGGKRHLTLSTVVPVAAPANLAPDILMGRRFSDFVKVQGQSIPLPEGLWTVLAHFRDSAGGRNRGDAVVMGRIDGHKLNGMIAVNAMQSGAGVSSAPFEACNRPDYVFRKVDTYDAQGEQRCWWINHAVAVWQNQPVFQAAQLELARLGVSAPQVMINVGIRRADATGFATTFYYFDPADDAIASASASWAESEWHRSRIDNDPSRRAYVQKLQRWGESWASIYFASR